MDKPLVYQLSCHGHCWVAMFGVDKRWKHLSAKPCPRWGIPYRKVTKGAFEIRRLIGGRCKHSNMFSRTVLIRREAWLTFFSNYSRLSGYPIGLQNEKCKLQSGLRWSCVIDEQTFRFAICNLKFAIRFYSGGNSDGVTPLPIPNREVKPISANGTALSRGGRVGRRQGVIFQASYQ